LTTVTTIPKAGHRTPQGRHARTHVTTIEVDNTGRVTGVNYVTDGTGISSRPGHQPSYTTKRAAAPAVEIEDVPQRAVEHRGVDGVFQPQTGGVTAVSVEHQRLSNGHRPRAWPTTGTTTSITRASTSSAAATRICSDRRPVWRPA
jgi:hypothetical protein